MLSHTDLKKGTLFIYNSQPYEVLDFSLNFQARGSSTVAVKIKNLITGAMLSKTFHTGDSFEEADVSKKEMKFLYVNPIRNVASNGASGVQYFFCEAKNPDKRFPLTKEQIGNGANFLKANDAVYGFVFDEKVINVEIPIKVQLKVVEAAAYLRSGRAEAGTKEVILETGAKIQAPSFIKEGDVIEINTETESYVRRIE